MPSRKATRAAVAATAAPASTTRELVGRFGSGPICAQEVHAASTAFKKALIERAPGGELNHHLSYPLGAEQPEETRNHRNDTNAKTVLTEADPLRIETPWDREGNFEPLLSQSTSGGLLGLIARLALG